MSPSHPHQPPQAPAQTSVTPELGELRAQRSLEGHSIQPLRKSQLGEGSKRPVWGVWLVWRGERAAREVEQSHRRALLSFICDQGCDCSPPPRPRAKEWQWLDTGMQCWGCRQRGLLLPGPCRFLWGHPQCPAGGLTLCGSRVDGCGPCSSSWSQVTWAVGGRGPDGTQGPTPIPAQHRRLSGDWLGV